MFDSASYQLVIDKVRTLCDNFYQMDRNEGRFVENSRDIFTKAKDAAFILKIKQSAEPENIQTIILEANTAFYNLTGLTSDNVINQPISVIESIKGIKYFDWNKIVHDMSFGSGHGIFDFYTPQLEKWLRFTTTTPEKGLLIVLITDITEIKNLLIPHYMKIQSESAITENEE